jgi:hypothetical protein
MTPERDQPEVSRDPIDASIDESIESIRDAVPKAQEREVERSRQGAGPADVAGSTRATALLAPNVVDELRNRWYDVQAGFVDEPRSAVRQADGLVNDAIERLAQSFSNERAQLEAQWDRGGDVSTEDLRLALQRYRSFFSRLLSI